MGIAREVGSTNEYTIYAQSAEDYLTSHAAFDSDVEFSLNLFLRTEYGIDLAGKMNDSIEGELFGPEELIYTYDSETGKYVALSTDLLNSNFFMDTLQKGTPYFIPSLDKDRHLDFTNPKMIKVSQYKGEDQLFIMGDRQLRHAEDELKHVEKPTFWQRFADGFLKIFGSRNAACENYEKFQAMMESTLKGMHKDYDKVKELLECTNFGAKYKGDVFELEEPVNARYVRVEMNYNSANPSVHMKEFEVYGVEDPNYVEPEIPTSDIKDPENVAYGKPVHSQHPAGAHDGQGDQGHQQIGDQGKGQGRGQIRHIPALPLHRQGVEGVAQPGVVHIAEEHLHQREGVTQIGEGHIGDHVGHVQGPDIHRPHPDDVGQVQKKQDAVGDPHRREPGQVLLVDRGIKE